MSILIPFSHVVAMEEDKVMITLLESEVGGTGSKKIQIWMNELTAVGFK